MRKLTATVATTLLFLSCGRADNNKKPITTSIKQNTLTQITLDKENRIPDRQIRRLTLDLLNRLPTESDRAIYKKDVDSAASLISFYLSSNEADEALAKLHKNIWALWRPRALESLSEKDAALATSLSQNHSSIVSDEPVKILRFILSNNLSFERVFTTPFTLMTPETASFFGQTTSPTSTADTGSISFNSISRPSLGILSTFGWHASISHQKSQKNHSGAAETIEKIACINLRSTDSHNFQQEGIKSIDSEMIPNAMNNEKCASCHNQFHSLAEGVPFYAQANSFAKWKTYNSSEFSPGQLRGKEFQNDEDLKQIFASDSRIFNCELKKITEEILQRPLDSLKDQYLIEEIYQNWSQTKKIKNLISSLISIPEYSHQILGNSKAVKSNSLSAIRILGPSQWQGFVSQYLPYSSFEKMTLETPSLPKSASNPEIFSVADLTPRQENNRYSQPFTPSEEYTNAQFELSQNIAETIVENEIKSSIPSEQRILLTTLPDNDAYHATSEEINSQIIKIWNTWTSIEVASDDIRIKKIRGVYDEAVLDGLTNLDKSRNAWAWVVISILMSPEFIIY